MPLVLNGLRQTLAQAAARRHRPRESIVLDPGFGFGKLGPDNFILLNHLADLHQLGYPILAGLSRKRFLTAHLTTHTRTDPRSHHRRPPALHRSRRPHPPHPRNPRCPPRPPSTRAKRSHSKEWRPSGARTHLRLAFQPPLLCYPVAEGKSKCCSSSSPSNSSS